MNRPLESVLDASANRTLLQEKGLGGTAAAEISTLLAVCGAELQERGVDRSRPVTAYFVPGRIEVLGKHTDYGGGRSLLAAVERGICMIGSPRSDDEVRITDIGRGERAVFRLGEPVKSVGGWTNYPGTVVRRLGRNFPGARSGADLTFASNLPAASGMSSSSALMIATFLTLAGAIDLEADPLYQANFGTPEELGEYLAAVENGSDFRELAGDLGVGTKGGSEDHTAILCGRAGHLVQYSFAPIRFEASIPLPEGYCFVLAGSGVRAEKTGPARDRYNSASALMGEIRDSWNRFTGRSDPTVGSVLRSGAGGADELRRAVREAAGSPEEVPGLLARLDQFLEESEEIVPAAAEALRAERLADLGALVDRSQELAERLLGNQVEETAYLARSARTLGAEAASAFGAGFGGSVWALVARSGAEEFARRWRADYLDRFPSYHAGADFFLSGAGPPAQRIA